jgi:TfoX/Sxy family transcriptional regulator of competence genes
MATDDEFATYVCGQIRMPNITKRKMFGEYAVYAGEKIVALIADNQLFVKPTEGGAKFIGTPVEAPPYPGAKNYYLIDDTDDPDFITKLMRITEKEAPSPKPKKTATAKKAAPAKKSPAKKSPAKKTAPAKKAAPAKKSPAKKSRKTR